MAFIDEGMKRMEQAVAKPLGIDRVRFVAPVRTGSRIRGVFSLVALEQQAANRFQMRLAVTVEIEGEVKPALVADWQTVLFMVQDRQSLPRTRSQVGRPAPLIKLQRSRTRRSRARR